jgi:hypothetical protein
VSPPLLSLLVVSVADSIAVYRTNSFMDRMNSEFFRPRGLYCLIMSYNPISTDKQEKVDIAQAMSNHEPSSSGSGFSSRAKRNLRNPSAGVSHGEENLPDSVATLVYPGMPNATLSPSETNTKNKVFARLNNYFDRRAHLYPVSGRHALGFPTSRSHREAHNRKHLRRVCASCRSDRPWIAPGRRPWPDLASL